MPQAGVVAPEDAADGVPVGEITFTGVERVPASALAAAMATRSRGILPWGRKPLFNRLQFEADLARIERFYADRGFPDARVVSATARLDEKRRRVDIHIAIEEGEALTAGAITFRGFDALPPEAREALDSLPVPREGQPLDRSLLRSARDGATGLLEEHGYPTPDVTVVETPVEGTRRVDVEIIAQPGETAVFGPIEIDGVRRVSDDVVRRALVYKPGDRFRRSALRQSQRNLYDLDLFDFANIQVLGERPAKGTVPTRVAVAEGKQRRFEFSVGYGTEDHLRGRIDWRNTNFLGGARVAGLQAKWSSLDRGVRGQFREPYLFGSRLSLGITTHRWYESEPAYRASTSGFRLSLGRSIGQATTVSLAYSGEFTSSRISNFALEDLSLRDYLIALGLDPTTGVQDGTVSAVLLDISRNTAGNLLDPSGGSYLASTVEVAGNWFGGDFSYVGVSLEGRRYQPLGPRVVLAARVRSGAIRPAGNVSEQVPFFKRYFLGGATSLRGWGRYQVSPLSGSGLPLGGFTLVEANAELRVRAAGSLGLVLFVEAGQVHSKAWRLEAGEMRYDAGPGLRYDTPVGPLRVDVGFQLNPFDDLLINGEPEKRYWRLHLSIGQAF